MPLTRSMNKGRRRRPLRQCIPRSTAKRRLTRQFRLFNKAGCPISKLRVQCYLTEISPVISSLTITHAHLMLRLQLQSLPEFCLSSQLSDQHFPLGQNVPVTPMSIELFVTTTPNSPTGTSHDCDTTSHTDTSYLDRLKYTFCACHGSRLTLCSHELL